MDAENSRSAPAAVCENSEGNPSCPYLLKGGTGGFSAPAFEKGEYQQDGEGFSKSQGNT